MISVKPSASQTALPIRANLVFSPAAGFACKTYLSFFESLADTCGVNIYSYDVRGTGDSTLPVAPMYKNGKTEVGAMLAEDFLELFWAIRDYANEESPECINKPWVVCGHSLGSWLGLHTALYGHIRRLVLLDPPLFQGPDAAKWALACSLNKRQNHPLSVMTRRRKRVFRNAEQAAWVFSKFEFFKKWQKARLLDYVNANYRMQDEGLVLRHNPKWEADIVESQPYSSTMKLLSMPKQARHNLLVQCVFGGDSPFCGAASELLVRTAFSQSNIHTLRNCGHMLVFEKQAELVRMFEEDLLSVDFLRREQTSETA